jgi:hypothetical protein
MTKQIIKKGDKMIKKGNKMIEEGSKEHKCGCNKNGCTVIYPDRKIEDKNFWIYQCSQ